MLGRDEVRAQVASPTYRARSGSAPGGLVDPAALALGLRAAALELGVRLHERTPVAARRRGGADHAGRELRAPRILLATNGYPPLMRAIRRLVAPVYDYVLVTEPLERPPRRDRLEGRQGVADRGNRSTTTA